MHHDDQQGAGTTNNIQNDLKGSNQKPTGAVVEPSSPTPIVRVIKKPIINLVKEERKKIDNLEDFKEKGEQETVSNFIIPIIIFTYKRAEYLKETIDTVLKYVVNNLKI